MAWDGKQTNSYLKWFGLARFENRKYLLCVYFILWDHVFFSVSVDFFPRFVFFGLYFLLLSFLLFLWRDTITIEPYGFWIVAFFLSLVLCLYYVFTCIAWLFEPLEYRLQNGLASARSTFYSLLRVKPSV